MNRTLFTSKKFLSVSSVFLACVLTSCSLVRIATGNEFDLVQFEKARFVKMLEMKLEGEKKLAQRLHSSEPIDNADVVIFLNEKFISETFKQFDSLSFFIDSGTEVQILSSEIHLYPGSSVATFNASIRSLVYPMATTIRIDCMLNFILADSGRVQGNLQTFAIAPAVETSGIFTGSEDLIQRILTKKLAEIDEKLPHIKIPVDLKQVIWLDRAHGNSRGKIDINVESQRLRVENKYQLKEILILPPNVLIAINLRLTDVH